MFGVTMVCSYISKTTYSSSKDTLPGYEFLPTPNIQFLNNTIVATE